MHGKIYIALPAELHVVCTLYRAAILNIFGTRDQFRGRQYFHGGVGGVSGSNARDGGDGMVQAVMGAMRSGR